MDYTKKTVKCPICGKSVEFSEKLPPSFPFCSKRCKLVDLGKWLNEEYTIQAFFSKESLSKEIEVLDETEYIDNDEE